MKQVVTNPDSSLEARVLIMSKECCNFGQRWNNRPNHCPVIHEEVAQGVLKEPKASDRVFHDTRRSDMQ